MSADIDSVVTRTVYVRFLGAFQLEADGKVINDETKHARKLWEVLCYIIAHRDRTVLQTELIDLFWQNENCVNPASALKTLLFRLRALLAPLFEGGPEPIISQRGSYIWNKAITCVVDAEQFETLCRQAQSPGLCEADRLNCYREAAELYRGNYLPRLNDQLWIIPVSTHYHTLYIDMIKAYSALLQKHSDFIPMYQLCDRASQLDPLDEELHVLTIRALIGQGKNAEALTRYAAATELLYCNLGVRPSPELRQLYVEAMNTEQDLENDLELIQDTLKEVAEQPGAFVCEYGFFQESYRLEMRRFRRSGSCIHIALLTLSAPDNTVPSLAALRVAMPHLQAALVASLRHGDIISKYSKAQFVVMLPSANFEDSTMVMERVVSTFYQQNRRNYLKLSYKIRALH